ncbi:hypothetical protein GX51_06986 [Blastomyces parvus]|uniref:Uncharacterized protein n=1 Tax=Blastomyces parvus TaxID=2060905 RepID=A0A2B7WN52_9EURO|nr:hypothetical protein GX51_06986 [Blastomyces parvus]
MRFEAGAQAHNESVFSREIVNGSTKRRWRYDWMLSLRMVDSLKNAQERLIAWDIAP